MMKKEEESVERMRNEAEDRGKKIYRDDNND